MNNLHNYLKKFTNIVSRDKTMKERCRDAIRIHTGHEIELDAISVQQAIIFLSLHPTIKTHILQNKEEIVGHINSNMFGFKVEGIR